MTDGGESSCGTANQYTIGDCFQSEWVYIKHTKEPYQSTSHLKPLNNYRVPIRIGAFDFPVNLRIIRSTVIGPLSRRPIFSGHIQGGRCTKTPSSYRPEINFRILVVVKDPIIPFYIHLYPFSSSLHHKRQYNTAVTNLFYATHVTCRRGPPHRCVFYWVTFCCVQLRALCLLPQLRILPFIWRLKKRLLLVVKCVLTDSGNGRETLLFLLFHLHMNKIQQRYHFVYGNLIRYDVILLKKIRISSNFRFYDL